MPSRILREELCSSDRLHLATPEEERLFTRLIVVVDDFGRMDARPSLVRSKCFPIWDDLSSSVVAGWLVGLQNRRLLRFYRDAERHRYFTIHKPAKARAEKSKCGDPLHFEDGVTVAMLLGGSNSPAPSPVLTSDHDRIQTSSRENTDVPYSLSYSNPLSNSETNTIAREDIAHTPTEGQRPEPPPIGETRSPEASTSKVPPIAGSITEPDQPSKAAVPLGRTNEDRKPLAPVRDGPWPGAPAGGDQNAVLQAVWAGWRDLFDPQCLNGRMPTLDGLDKIAAALRCEALAGTENEQGGRPGALLAVLAKLAADDYRMAPTNHSMRLLRNVLKPENIAKGRAIILAEKAGKPTEPAPKGPPPKPAVPKPVYWEPTEVPNATTCPPEARPKFMQSKPPPEVES